MKPRRVAVAMSGGVDSSVAAALLVEQGCEVIGLTMQLWPELGEEVAVRHDGCCSVEAAGDARRVADHLGIPYYVLNFRESFEARVILPFIQEYARGRTPNPCLECNRAVKFGDLLQRALALELDALATGHYARVAYDRDLGRWLLYKGVDPHKDQSYALYGLTQDQLSRVLFPLGHLRKQEVREIARSRNLPVADKQESQEICFVVEGDYRDFLSQRIPKAISPGPIVDLAGRRLGTHRGLPFYTVGQRQGLGIAGERPLYVVRLDVEANTLVVGDAEQAFAPGLLASQPNWIALEEFRSPVAVQAKIRYGARGAPAVIEPAGQGRVQVHFELPQRAITPGQAVVFYQDELVVGGATIDGALYESRPNGES